MRDARRPAPRPERSGSLIPRAAPAAPREGRATPALPGDRPPAEREWLAAARSLVRPTGRPASLRLSEGQRSGRKR
eukprot:13237965-Alexandrium_andersonii.AAC.1